MRLIKLNGLTEDKSQGSYLQLIAFLIYTGFKL